MVVLPSAAPTAQMRPVSITSKLVSGWSVICTCTGRQEFYLLPNLVNIYACGYAHYTSAYVCHTCTFNCMYVSKQQVLQGACNSQRLVIRSYDCINVSLNTLAIITSIGYGFRYGSATMLFQQ